jgi:membrane-associated protease RseP (regulator of RpoE activity)
MKYLKSIFICSAITIVTILIFESCTVTQPLATPSGKPDVTINTTDRGKIKSAIINRFMSGGYQMVSESDYGVVFSRQWNNFNGILYQSLLGNSYSSTPNVIIRINMATLDGATRVLLQPSVSMQNAFGREDINELTNRDLLTQFQQLLQEIKNEVELTDRPRIGINVDEKGTIVQVIDGWPAQKSGILVGDSIIYINGNPFTDTQTFSNQLLESPDSVVEIIVLRNNEKLTFNIEKVLLK